MKALLIYAIASLILLTTSCTENKSESTNNEVQAIFLKGELGPAENFTGILTLYLNTMNAENNIVANPSLSAQQQSIVSIAALTAVGNMEQLKAQLYIGLGAGLTVNEIKEVLVQLYAYCGFPRSLNAINTFMSVVEERKAKGIKDVEGKVASPLAATENKYETGKKNLQTLTGKEEKGPKSGAAAFAPAIDSFLKEHLFADIFNRDVLTYQQRELATIAVLSALEGTASQLEFHLAVGKNIGFTESQLKQVFSLIETHIRKKQAEVAKTVLAKMVVTKPDRSEIIKTSKD